MTELLLRNLEEHDERRLKERAASHGRSVEEEARAMLREALEPPERAGEPGAGNTDRQPFPRHWL